jgi:alkylhydroperoxidase family enzyme
LTRRGLTEDDVQCAVGPLDGAGLDEPTIAALQLVDVLTSPRPAVAPELLDELRRHFDDGAILELAVAISVAAGWQRFIEAFGIRPDSWRESTRLPFTWPPPK